MAVPWNDWATWPVGSASLAALGGGLLTDSFLLGAVGAAGLGYVALRCRTRRAASAVAAPGDDAPQPPSIVQPLPPPAGPTDIGALVDGMLTQDRYALLLRRQLVSNLSHEQFHRARQALEEQMALVPAGNVSLGDPDDGDVPRRDEPPASMWHVAALFLDRYPVTNVQYRRFVDSGGYEQVSIWDPQIWPAVLDFADTTGHPGPRFWKHGCYASGEEEFPVVGVSWYEATAYARWVGKRLPTEAEWVKAGSWPVPLSPTMHSQRKFPWGDTMDRERCHLWGSGPGRVVSVREYSQGVSVGGVYQLIGNVWEWTTANFGNGAEAGREWALSSPMKCIRGGAFDTYFENQATCQFQSGERPLARRHNIGFRCALGVCDVAVSQPQAEPEDSSPAAEESRQATGASA